MSEKKTEETTEKSADKAKPAEEVKEETKKPKTQLEIQEEVARKRGVKRQPHIFEDETEEIRNAKVKIDVISPGDGKTFPKKGDLLTVHYTGTLENGKKFDSSLDRRQPFRFKFGEGRVIRGWERSFDKMSLGEKAKLTIPGPLAYGDRGFPGLIPPNSTLIFEVEILKID